MAELYARCEEFLLAFIPRVEGRYPSSSSPPSALPADAVRGALAPAIPSPNSTPRTGQEHSSQVGVGHERILLVSHAGTIIALTRVLTGDEGIERGMRVGCCTLTTLQRTPTPTPFSSSSSSSPPSIAAGSSESLPALPPPPRTPSAPAVRGVIGRGVWTVRGAPADGAFLAGGVERSWGMADVETREGVVVEDPGIPGSEGEEDGPNGVQVWWSMEVPSPKM